MQVVILAAGESSRFWPLNKEQHKSLMKLRGKPLIYWTVKNLADCGIKDIIIISDPRLLIKNELGNGQDLGCRISYAVQKKPLGTGNALFQAKDLIKEPFIVLHPYKFYIKDIIGQIVGREKGTDAKIILIGSRTYTPWEYGILRIRGNKVLEICENPKKGKEPSNVKSLGTYFLHPDFFEYYKKVKPHHEEDLIDGLNLFIKDNEAQLIFLDNEPPTLKYSWNLLDLSRLIFNFDFKGGISPSAKIGKNVVIDGDVFIGDNAVIGDGTIIHGPVYIGNDCHIGMCNVMRGPVDLESGVKTGAFFEIKNSIVQDGSHFHSGYIGDSIVGGNCRFGAGVVTANRRTDRKSIHATVKNKKIDTGLTYFGMVVGSGTKTGVNCSFMPGVLVGSDCVIGPNSVVFKNIENSTHFYTKFKEVKESLKETK